VLHVFQFDIGRFGGLGGLHVDELGAGGSSFEGRRSAARPGAPRGPAARGRTSAMSSAADLVLVPRVVIPRRGSDPYIPGRPRHRETVVGPTERLGNNPERRGVTMTGMSSARDDQHTASADMEPVAGSASDYPSRLEASPTFRKSIWFLEHTQDVVTVAVGIILIALASVLLAAGIIDFVDGNYGSIAGAGTELLDRVLLVLILVEIVYTVVLSLRAHRLVAQPFIVVGLIAVIRRILFVLTPGSRVTASTSELALLIGMVAVFVAGLIAVSLFERKGED
jgi:uncharacterized membrane protein (DUF373 family)